jgi:hypothetical protein
MKPALDHRATLIASFAATDSINQSMLTADAPGPIPLQNKLQWLWFADTFEWIFLYGFEQLSDLLSRICIMVEPEAKLFPGMSAKLNNHGHSLDVSGFEGAQFTLMHLLDRLLQPALIGLG